MGIFPTVTTVRRCSMVTVVDLPFAVTVHTDPVARPLNCASPVESEVVTCVLVPDTIVTCVDGSVLT